MNAFEYLIFTYDEAEDAGSVLAGPTVVLAKDLDQAKLMAAMAIPVGSNLNQVRVVVRPFNIG
jgi:hypothetical protein